MGTTTNNGWPTPVATDLVKDGWEAIKDLGDAIDTTLGVYTPSTPGLTLINTTSFSAVSSFILPNNTFTATYDYYLILMQFTTTVTEAVNMRLRAAGVDDSSANYNRQKFTSDSTTNTGVRATGQTSGNIGDARDTGVSMVKLTLFNPFLAEPTLYLSEQGQRSATTSTFLSHINGGLNTSTSYDSASFIAAGGLLSGKYFVYGFGK